MYDELPQLHTTAKPTQNIVRHRRHHANGFAAATSLLSVAIIGTATVAYLRYSGQWDALSPVWQSARQYLASAWQWVRSIFA